MDELRQPDSSALDCKPRRPAWTLLAGLALAAGGALAAPAQADGAYLGASGAVVVQAPGCNATSPAQIPGSADLFINRAKLTPSGGLVSADSCKGAQWSLTLSQMDWGTHKLRNIKTLLDTTEDPATHRLRTVITGGPMRGAAFRSAYDADVVKFRGEYFVSFECWLQDDGKYGVNGTSSCISVYNPATQSLDLNRTQVIISGQRISQQRFVAAAVPQLLAYQDRLFVYWSALATDQSKFAAITVRGAELEVNPDRVTVKGSRGAVVHALDEPLTTQVWGPDPADPTANTTVDVRTLWVSGDKIIAMSSQVGQGCIAPSGTTPGCFHLVIVKADHPIGQDIFNHSPKVDPNELPSNQQEYTRPVRGPQGGWWFIGHYIHPTANGWSERRPAPGGDFWRSGGGEALIMYPLTDESLHPTQW